jgi:hypothetical protein
MWPGTGFRAGDVGCDQAEPGLTQSSRRNRETSETPQLRNSTRWPPGDNFGGDATVGKSEPNGLIQIAFDARDVNLVMGAEG